VIAPDRVADIRASNALTGIDFVQVAPTQLELFVFVQHLALPAPLAAALATITPDQVHIDAQGAVAPAHVRVLQHVLPIPLVDGRPALHLVVQVPGGFGWYRLRIDHPALDTFFNDILFSFKACCPSEFASSFVSSSFGVITGNDEPPIITAFSVRPCVTPPPMSSIR